MHAALAVHPLGLDRVEPGAVAGQQATEDPHALPGALDPLIVRPQPALTSWLMCQPALSQTSSSAVFPRAASRSLHQARNWVVSALTGRAVHEAQQHLVGRGQVEAVAGQRLRVGIVGCDRLLDQPQGPARPPPRSGRQARPGGSTTSRPRSRAPSPGGSPPGGSGGRAGFFSGVRRVGAGDPALGALPADAQPGQRGAHRLAAHAVRRSAPRRR